MTLETANHEDTDAGARRVHAPGDLPAVIALAVVGVVAVGASPLVAGPLALAVVTPALIRIDVAERRLPNRLVLPCYPVALAGIAVDGILTATPPVTALVSCGAWLLFFLVMNLAGGMGMGDVKLAGVLGLCLGSIGVAVSLGGIVLAFLLGGVGAVSVLLRRVGGRRGRIPFGPFLLAGFWIAVALTPVLVTP
ncbi:MAG: A24 family peptidase [Mycetocola sp.]